MARRLISKLSRIRIPSKLGNWHVSFIKYRNFYVKSELFNINAGLGQGTILSPTLFSIYINDLTESTSESTNKSSNLLFVGDLFNHASDQKLEVTHDMDTEISQ